MFTWGFNSYGQLGDSTTINKSSPVQIGTSSWIAIASSRGGHAAAIRLGGSLFTWGRNNSGQLGSGTTTNRSSPVQVGTSSWNAVAAGANHTLAIKYDTSNQGPLFAWGYNGFGQLGDGTTVNKSSPVQIGADTWFVSPGSLTAGNQNSAAIQWVFGQRRLHTWGTDGFGQLGDGESFGPKSSPVQIGSDSWIVVTMGGIGGQAITHGITANGFLFGWGFNYGRLSIGDSVSRSSPVLVGSTPVGTQYTPLQVGTFSWVAVAAGVSHSAAIKSDYKLFTWGRNHFGQLGDGTTVNKSSPVQIGSSSWVAVAAGGFHSAAIRSDYKLFTWGRNNSGQLGDGTLVTKSSPVQIGSSSWTAVSTGYGETTAAIRSDYKLFTWGSNSNGILGDETSVSKSSPVQIGTSSWTAVSAGTYHTVGLMKVSA